MACNQRGMALVSVVVMLAVLLTLSHILAEKIWQSTRRVGAENRQEQALWATQGGIEAARQTLATSYADSRGWRNYLSSAGPAYPDAPAWVSTVNGFPVEIFLRDNPDGDDDLRTDNDLKIFVLARARGPGEVEAMVESLCGFEQPSATGTTETGQATGDMLIDLSAQPVSTYDIAD
jgi:type II secretory pathway pseudopilin PulG